MEETEVKIRKLEEQLKRVCLDRNILELGGFTFMFDDENGRIIKYVKNMPIEQTGDIEFYDRNSTSFVREYNDIQWPYMGFVQGNMLGWMPISITQLCGWIENSPYTVGDFIEHFHEKTKIDNKKWKQKI